MNHNKDVAPDINTILKQINSGRIINLKNVKRPKCGKPKPKPAVTIESKKSVVKKANGKNPR